MSAGELDRAAEPLQRCDGHMGALRQVAARVPVTCVTALNAGRS